MRISSSSKTQSSTTTPTSHSNSRRHRCWRHQSCYEATTTIALLVIACQLVILKSNAEVVDHVTCGSVVKLTNEAKPKVRLHSHPVNYGSGSGQQSVTAAENQDTNSYWAILGSKTKRCNRGEPIECGSIIRFQHVQTRKFLHSHLFKSPLSGQQEVSAFGGDDDSDTGDHWMLYCSGKIWKKTELAKLKHVDTDQWLSLSGKTYGSPIYGQMEVVCVPEADRFSLWKIVEGIFIQPTGKTNSIPLHDEL